MRRPRRRTIVICPGRPVQRSPAARSARSVERWPAGPKSSAWLLARFITSKPAPVMSLAYERRRLEREAVGGARRTSIPGSRESVSSRFPKATSAARSGPTTGAIESRPASGGVP